MAPTIQEHAFSVPGAQEEILQRYTVFKNLEIVYTPDSHDASVLIANKEEFITEVKTAYKELATYTAGVITNAASSAVDKSVAQEFLTSSGREFSNFLNLYSRICLQVQNRDSVLDPNQDRSNSGSDVSASSEAVEKARVAKVDRDIDIIKMADAIDCLRLDINKEQDWTTADSNTVEIAMKNIASWRDKLSFIKNKFWDIQRHTQAFNLDEDVLSQNEIDLNTIVGETEAAIEKIQKEDRDRCLYSGLDKSKVTPIKYPTFSGCLSEDYVKWEKETKEVLVKNQVRTEDKSKIVRSNLTGQALKLIPETIANVEVLFSALSDLYGDPSRVMKNRKDQLTALGVLPAVKGKTRVSSQVRAQVEWLLSAEMILEDIVNLAKISPDMDRGAYNPDALQDYLDVFPMKTTTELSQVQGNIQAKVKSLLQVHVKDRRKELQDTLKSLKSD